jgi:hypothetical protein
MRRRHKGSSGIHAGEEVTKGSENMSIVITHHEDGIYLGHALGLGFWSLLDTAGQSQAATFESERQAREHVASWVDHNDPDEFDYREVACANEFYATVQELKAAGLGEMLGEMELEHLRNTPAMGMC